MFRVAKKEDVIVKAYKVEKIKELLEKTEKERLVKQVDENTYEVFSRETTGIKGEIIHTGDYVKFDCGGNLYPNKKTYFESNHIHLEGDKYKQNSKPLKAWNISCGNCEEIEFLKKEKGLLINEEDEIKYFGAPLWGSFLTAPKDSFIIFYSVEYENKKIKDVDFNFVVKEEFEKTYKFI